jgi:hypothetical protein
MSDDPYFPNDEKRIEIRILLPLRGHAAPWEVAKTVMAGIDENATALFGVVFSRGSDRPQTRHLFISGVVSS